MKDRKILFTAFAIFLLMGAAPLQAARVHGAEDAVQKQAIGHVEHAKIGPFGPSCDTLQENFLRLNNETSASLTALHNGEQLSFAAKVGLAMKMRGMLRAARRAASSNCDWLADSNVTNFQQRVAEIGAMSPCASTAREMIESAGDDLDEEEQQEVARDAVLILMSPTCELPEDEEDDEDDEDDESDVEEGESEDGLGDALSEENPDNTQEEDDILEEIDELSDELTATALNDPNGASLLQQNQGQLEVVLVGAFFALFFGFFFLLWLPFIVGAACLLTGLGFLVFSLIGCLLYSVMRLLLGRHPGGCPALNWLPYCPQIFTYVIVGIWGDNVGGGYGGGGYNTGYVNNHYGAGYVAPGYVAPVVTTGVYYDRRRRFFGASYRHNQRRNRAVRRANRRARRANMRARRANMRARRANRRANRRARRARRANRRARRMGRRGMRR